MDRLPHFPPDGSSGLGGPAPPGSHELRASTRIGTEVAGFRIESVLGRGGMSVVYVAEQIRLARKVALKVLTNELAWDEQFRERFVRESHIAATIDHPNIIPIYDAGEADGLLYIAMRFVQGPDLKEILKRGTLGVGRTIFLIEQLASALDAAHAHALVHRDVKPGNILVEESTDHVYLTDFGVAKQTTARGLTSTGHFLGTVEYAAPEQIEGGPVGARTDVYALGCVLYECLTGSPPFSHGTEHAVLHAHLVDPPPSVSRVRPDLPQAFDGVVATAMAKAPEDRFGSCGELANAARNAASGTARRVDGSPPASTSRRSPRLRLPPRPRAAGAGARARAPRRPRRARAPLRRLESPAGTRLTPLKQMLLTLLLVVLAATASGLVVYFLTRQRGIGGSACRRTGPRHPQARRPRSGAGLAHLQGERKAARGRARDGGVPAARGCHDLHTRPPRGLHLRERRSRPARVRGRAAPPPRRPATRASATA